MNSKKETVNLGTITIDRKDPRTRQLLMKFFQEVQKGNYTWTDPHKVEG